MDDLPNVDEDVVQQNEQRYNAKEAMKLDRVLGGEDDRIAEGNTTTGQQRPMTLAEHEEKWRFSYEELQAATKVVSVLFSNPSLYVGDQYLADSRLYTMITRDRKTKRENQEVLRHVLNEERNRKEKIKRQQDIATIRKTTMKKEREEALGNLLLSNDAPQLLIEGNDNKSATESDAALLLQNGPKAEEVPVSQKSPTEQVAKPASEDSTSIDGETRNSRLYLKRFAAGLELLDVIHNPQTLIPAISLAKPAQSNAADQSDNDDNDDGEDLRKKKPAASAAPVHVVRIKHGNNNKKGKKQKNSVEEEDDVATTSDALSPSDVQLWRCHLTSLFHRFWPVKEFSTQMTLNVPVADSWPPLTSSALKGLASGAEGRITVDDIHHSLCVATSQVSLIVESLLDDYNRMVEGGNNVSTTSVLEYLTAGNNSHSSDSPVAHVVRQLRSAVVEGSKSDTTHSAILFGDSLSAARVPKEPASIAQLRAQLIENVDGDDDSGQGYVETVPLQELLSEVATIAAAANTTDIKTLSSRLIGLELLVVLAEAIREHWTQYKRKFAATFKVTSSQSSKPFVPSSNQQQRDDKSEEIDEDDDHHHPTQADGSAHPDLKDPFYDPNPSESILSRANFAKLAWSVSCYFGAVVYSADPTIFDGSRKLFNGIKLAWPGLPPEAEADGTILGEEGVFEMHLKHTSDGASASQMTGLPYQDAMVFAAPSSSATSSAPANSSNGYAPSGCIVALRKETSATLRMNRTQKCHTCKGRYNFLHPFYYSMCRPCSDYNYNKRLITRDLAGKVILLTGVRIKIGYAMAISMLRCGATVIGTTRFAMDAVGRFSAEPDYEQWNHRLHLYSVDLRDLWLVTQFCNFLSRKFPKMFAIINNAAQTIARTPAYTADLRRLEADPPTTLVEKLNQDKSAAEWRTFFLQNTSVTVGQSLHLEYHPTENPIVDGEFTNENTAMRSQVTEVSGSSHGAHTFSAAAEAFLAKETPEEKLARLRRDGGDAIGAAVLNDAQLATAMARRSDRYDTYAEESDKREKNSWTLNMHEVQGSEATEVMAINALSPFILNSRLKPLLLNREGEEDGDEEDRDPQTTSNAASSAPLSNRAKKRQAVAQSEGASQAWNTKKGSRFIINVSAMEGQFYRHKLTTHPHTNMAKAALNMMTRTSAEDYARDGIFMNSVDTGWITDESPTSKKQRRADDHMLCPLDEVDAAARCLDLIYTDSREYGKFWKNYKVIPW
eukprot:GILI01011207.1.p1 GENE.GILI01011207.1~~GILI01011207.1.p1  ORF type:complete len:1232 (-),score=258.68 GILI01011207.1:54-3749(-)